ncbi:hypothetical protein [Pseudomonas abieticivorans]|uniref:hypothetical protein n=1 Tax=Pseudomonas abieticivorans TaxID=2931382 RepID=UPI0020BEDE30|nr:hypothetical protein [Pseudomonas sp. PIA16]
MNTKDTELPAPLLEGLADGLLVPQAAGLKVTVCYPDMRDSDLVALNWVGEPGDGTPDLEPRWGDSTSGRVEFLIADTAIAANTGKPVMLFYAMVRDAEQWLSATLEFEVGVAQEEVPPDPEPDPVIVEPTKPPLSLGSSPLSWASNQLVPVLVDYPQYVAQLSQMGHLPSGGLAPYAFASSNPAVAVVDGAGTLWPKGAGTTVITVTDALGQQQSYSFCVPATAVVRCKFFGPDTWAKVRNAAKNAGFPVTNSRVDIVHSHFRGQLPPQFLQKWFWTRDGDGQGYASVLRIDQFVFKQVPPGGKYYGLGADR